MTAQSTVLGQGIVKVDSGNEGYTVGVFCNVHGNEPCGRASLRRLLDAHSIVSGSLIIVDANPEAALLDQRFVTADMNRMFTATLLASRNPHHDLARAQYLASLLPQLNLDFAVDLHSTSSATKFPFAVGFTGSDQIIELCPLTRIIGWNESFMAGTLVEWLCSSGVPAATVEGGQHRSEDAVVVAESVLSSVLHHLNLIKLNEPFPIDQQNTFEIVKHVTVGDAASFEYTKLYSSFDELEPNEVIAIDKEGKYLAPSESGFSLLMPGEQLAINQGTVPDAYYLIRTVCN